MRAVPPDAPLVVAGDFNDWRGRAPMRCSRLRPTEVFRSANGRHARTFPARWPLLRLDRIYVRNRRARPLPMPRRPGPHCPTTRRWRRRSSCESSESTGCPATASPARERRGLLPARVRCDRAAEHEVLLETFILFDDKVGRELQQALFAPPGAARGARAGRWLGLARPAAVVHCSRCSMPASGCAASSRRSACSAPASTCCAACTASWWWSTAGARLSAASTTRSTTSPTPGRSPSRTTRSKSRARWSDRSRPSAAPAGRAAAGRRLWLQRWRRAREVAPAARRDADAAAQARWPRSSRATTASHRTDIERHYRAAVRTARAARTDRQRLFLSRLPVAEGPSPRGAARRAGAT